MGIDLPKDLEIDDTEREFNSQIEFFKELYRIRERRNLFYESGQAENFFRSTRSLLSCASPKLQAEGINTKDMKDKLKTIWNKIMSLMMIKDENIKAKNGKLYEFELMEVSDELNEMIHNAGIIYPKKVKKTIEQSREEDY